MRVNKCTPAHLSFINCASAYIVKLELATTITETQHIINKIQQSIFLLQSFVKCR